MRENMYCSAQKSNSKEFNDKFDSIKWKTKKNIINILCPICFEYYKKEQLVDKGEVYHCPKCDRDLLYKKLRGGFK